MGTLTVASKTVPGIRTPAGRAFVSVVLPRPASAAPLSFPIERSTGRVYLQSARLAPGEFDAGVD